MKAFLNDEAVKQKYLNRVREHARLDEIHKGQYVDETNRKFCAVGCTIHSPEHNRYEIELGIPEWLARLEDAIFEGLPFQTAKKWPERFLVAIKVGSDLEKIKTPFLTFILEQNLIYLDSLPDMSDFKEVKKAIEGSRAAVEGVLRCHREGLVLSESAAESAWSAAESAALSAVRSAAWSARSDALSAVRSAALSAAWSARSDAWSAVRSAALSAAWSARSDAWSAAESAALSAAWSAAESARSDAYEKYADKLIELIESCE